MNTHSKTPRREAVPSRRTFVQGLAISAAASIGLLRQSVSAQTPQRAAQAVLTGTDFDLRIGATTVNVTGKARTAQTINGSLPGPLLRWREGDTVSLRVANGCFWRGINDEEAKGPCVSERGGRGRLVVQEPGAA